VLDAIATFPVQVTTGGDVFVTVPEKPVPSKVTPHMCKPHPNDARHFVIIGAGPAAAAAVETLRHGKFHGKITLVTKEAALPYDRTKLSKNMAIGAEEVALRTADFWRDELSVDVRLGAEVVNVDPEDRTITLASGEKLGFEKLLVASGGPARTFRAPESFVIPGADAGRIFPLRETAHSEGIEATVGALGVDAPIVIVGSSFIGMEAAAYLRKSKGVSTSVELLPRGAGCRAGTWSSCRPCACFTPSLRCQSTCLRCAVHQHHGGGHGERAV
jgi:apoptosis-inducing factor 3